MSYSQYLESYLEENADRIKAGKEPITIGTFLTNALKGRAADYAGKYGKSLRRACIAVGALEVQSARGGRAFIRIDDEIPRVEELAKEFFNCRIAEFGNGTESAVLWISDPQTGHYVGVKGAGDFYRWATDIIKVRSLPIHVDLLDKLLPELKERA